MKTLLISLGAVLLVLIGGGVYLFSGFGDQSETANENAAVQENVNAVTNANAEENANVGGTEVPLTLEKPETYPSDVYYPDGAGVNTTTSVEGTTKVGLGLKEDGAVVLAALRTHMKTNEWEESYTINSFGNAYNGTWSKGSRSVVMSLVSFLEDDDTKTTLLEVTY